MFIDLSFEIVTEVPARSKILREFQEEEGSNYLRMLASEGDRS